MLIGSTEIKLEKGKEGHVYVVGPTGVGKTRGYTIPNVKQEEKNIIVVVSGKQEIYHATHQTKEKQGYEIVQLDFLHPQFEKRLQDRLVHVTDRKFVVYIHANLFDSTYQERGERLQKLFGLVQETAREQAIHLFLEEYELYPIPNLLSFLQVVRKKGMYLSLIVQSHASLQQIYGKEAANQILTNCERTLFFGTHSMEEAKLFSRISEYDYLELLLLQNEVVVMDTYHLPQKIPIQRVDCKY